MSSVWVKFLHNVDNVDVNWLLHGIQVGFHLGVQPGPLLSAKRNCSSAFSQAGIIDKYLSEKIKEGTIAGPFFHQPFPNVQVIVSVLLSPYELLKIFLVNFMILVSIDR